MSAFVVWRTCNPHGSCLLSIQVPFHTQTTLDWIGGQDCTKCNLSENCCCCQSRKQAFFCSPTALMTIHAAIQTQIPTNARGYSALYTALASLLPSFSPSSGLSSFE